MGSKQWDLVLGARMVAGSQEPLPLDPHGIPDQSSKGRTHPLGGTPINCSRIASTLLSFNLSTHASPWLEHLLKFLNVSARARFFSVYQS